MHIYVDWQCAGLKIVLYLISDLLLNSPDFYISLSVCGMFEIFIINVVCW